MKQKTILLVCAVISFIIIISNDLFLSNITEVFEYGSELGDILSNFSLAYISSYIFYLLVVVNKDLKDKQNIYSTVYKLTNQLTEKGYSVFYQIIKASQTNQNEHDKKTISKEDYLNLCSKANPKAISPYVTLGTMGNPIPATYLQLIYNNAIVNVSHLSNTLFNYTPFLDSNFIKLLNNILNSELFTIKSALEQGEVFSNTDFSSFGPSMYSYIEAIRELENYNESHIKKFIK